MGLRSGLGTKRVVLLQGPQPVPFGVGKFGVVRGAEILLPADARCRATRDRAKDGRVGSSAAALSEQRRAPVADLEGKPPVEMVWKRPGLLRQVFQESPEGVFAA